MGNKMSWSRSKAYVTVLLDFTCITFQTTIATTSMPNTLSICDSSGANLLQMFLVNSKVTVEINLISFNNDNNQDKDGNQCDGNSWFNWINYCDTYFIFCISLVSSRYVIFHNFFNLQFYAIIQLFNLSYSIKLRAKATRICMHEL